MMLAKKNLCGLMLVNNKGELGICPITLFLILIYFYLYLFIIIKLMVVCFMTEAENTIHFHYLKK